MQLTRWINYRLLYFAFVRFHFVAQSLQKFAKFARLSLFFCSFFSFLVPTQIAYAKVHFYWSIDLLFDLRLSIVFAVIAHSNRLFGQSPLLCFHRSIRKHKDRLDLLFLFFSSFLTCPSSFSFLPASLFPSGAHLRALFIGVLFPCQRHPPTF